MLHTEIQKIEITSKTQKTTKTQKKPMKEQHFGGLTEEKKYSPSNFLSESKRKTA